MAEEIIYWEPAASIGQASFTSIPEEKEKIIYYVPPQTPQEAIERGVVEWKATKPKNFLAHWERLGISHKPKYWSCWWGCEGVQAVLDKDNKPTHDYYCPYWEMLMLFPDWEEDFSYTLFDRPPMPEGGPPLVEKEYNERKKEYREAIERRNEEAERNPYNIDVEQLALEHRSSKIRISKTAKDSGKQLARDGIRTTPFSKEYYESGGENYDNGNGIKNIKPKQKRISGSRKRTK